LEGGCISKCENDLARFCDKLIKTKNVEPQKNVWKLKFLFLDLFNIFRTKTPVLRTNLMVTDASISKAHIEIELE
jgi:hypothetical protein